MTTPPINAIMAKSYNLNPECPLNYFLHITNVPLVVDKILENLSGEDLQCLALTSALASQVCHRELARRKEKIL